MQAVGTQRSERTYGQWERLKHSAGMGSGLCFVLEALRCLCPCITAAPEGFSAPLVGRESPVWSHPLLPSCWERRDGDITPLS